MRVSWSLRRWLRLPSRVALLLGLGALSAAGARADTGLDRPGAGTAPPAHGGQANVGDLLIRTEGGRIYLSEAGGQFQELRLGDMPEADLLRQLLDRNGAATGAAGIRLGPTILAGDGGEGFHWAPADKTGRSAKPGAAHGLGTPAKAATPAGPTAPQQTPAPRGLKIGDAAQKG